ncbi:hypothetical protein FG87_36235 [Nocardia vulneris]|uniref:DNA-binding protein n=1 Tax=Nocardia vulneris TaxID=1141657 RepID=A0ABR4Z5E5_9NOCA|nr:hypothetical protein FG87_36235 [Nocardia vulneris]
MRSDDGTFKLGQQWRCASCGRIETVSWDDELRRMAGLPDIRISQDGVSTLLCDDCSFDSC